MATGMDANSNDAAVGDAGERQKKNMVCPECADTPGWTSPDGWGTCSTYEIGGMNEGYCDSDGASTACQLSCGTCDPCYEEEFELSFLTMLMLICAVFCVGIPVLKTIRDCYNAAAAENLERTQMEREKSAAEARARGMRETGLSSPEPHSLHEGLGSIMEEEREQERERLSVDPSIAGGGERADMTRGDFQSPHPHGGWGGTCRRWAA